MLGDLLCLLFGCSTVLGTSVLFYRCYEKTTDEYSDIESGNATDLINLLNNESLSLTFYIHGWKESCLNKSSLTIMSALLSLDTGGHICCFDWSAISKLDYVSAAVKVPEVGNILGRDMASISDMGFAIDQRWFIGFSMGAHVAGCAGQHLIQTNHSRPTRITGLDPALPLFYPPFNVHNSCRLNSSQSNLVDVVHTDGGVYGVPDPIGTCDFFPNSGVRYQKKCPWLPNTFNINEILPTYRCSHDRSWMYMGEAIRNKSSHLAVQCDDAEDFYNNSCSGNLIVALGFYLHFKSCSGTYYYETNGEPFYGRGKKGTYPNSS
ncbi:lipase member H-like isoform X1 [Neodiprion pinetum]|uniref:lipase member H-like isoform X1 n=2 Tax=Neodiprion pinetum TaxID=441929 RepID=UPI001EDCD94D|nr:lipase member H-like isoform X1 [Neodiprion pinetum]XP_046465580.1 lipase member H-like isoform X1 [Neodiprion pinetum]